MTLFERCDDEVFPRNHAPAEISSAPRNNR